MPRPKKPRQLTAEEKTELLADIRQSLLARRIVSRLALKATEDLVKGWGKIDHLLSCLPSSGNQVATEASKGSAQASIAKTMMHDVVNIWDKEAEKRAGEQQQADAEALDRSATRLKEELAEHLGKKANRKRPLEPETIH